MSGLEKVKQVVSEIDSHEFLTVGDIFRGIQDIFPDSGVSLEITDKNNYPQGALLKLSLCLAIELAKVKDGLKELKDK